MKNILMLLVIGFTLFSCKKDKVKTTNSFSNHYYQSDGNLLVLMIGESVECAFEYNLGSTQLNNDSLPVNIETIFDGVNNTSYCRFIPNPDTLFWYSSNDITFMTEKINGNQLLSHNDSIPYDSTQFQLIDSQISFNYSPFWSKASKLDIVKTYRNSLPNSKIGITRLVINEFDEQLGFSLPVEKYLLFMVK